jgi:flagellar biosynthetic protein FliP
VPDRAANRTGNRRWALRSAAFIGLIVALAVVSGAGRAAAAPGPPPVPVAPVSPITPVNPDRPSTSGSTLGGSTETGTGTLTADDASDSADASISLDLPGVTEKASNSVVIILLLTVLSVAPSLLVLCTSFTRIVIVLSLTRNALGLPTAPPQQVIVGLSVFLTLFVMGPTLGQMKDVALDPLLDGTISVTQAYDAAQVPLREFLLEHTREGELKMFLDASNTETPVARDEVPLVALVPAFVLSELKSGFIIGFVIFIPFLIIDLVVSAVLMGLGMMMLPPSFVSLPFKILLFVMLDGWMLVVGTLLKSYG